MSSGFVLSRRSLSNLEGVNPVLVDIVHYAIDVTSIDFGVISGVRTVEEQRELVARGASQTMNSKHLTGHAVDLMVYIGSRASWELNLYDDVAEAIRAGAIKYDAPVRWGAAWTVDDIRSWPYSMEEAMLDYIDIRRSEGRRPFIDAPHFELN